MRRVPTPLIAILAVAAAAFPGCSAEEVPGDPGVADSIARARQDSINRAQPGYIVDSILPIEEHLRRFRRDIPVAPTSLAGGATSRDALVRQFIAALEARDTTALAAMLLNRAEFAYLVYPESHWTRPPYRQAPGLVWMQAANANGTGFSRLLDRMAGRDLRFQSYACGSEPEVISGNRIWRDCLLSVERTPGDRRNMKLFAGIIERGGHFKIYSYGNDL
jgi:hypothetical protein